MESLVLCWIKGVFCVFLILQPLSIWEFSAFNLHGRAHVSEEYEWGSAVLQVWISEKQGVCLFFILLELATTEAIFSNVKLCFVHFLCNSFGTWKVKTSSWSQVSQQEHLKSSENCKANRVIYIPAINCAFSVVFLYVTALFTKIVWAVSWLPHKDLCFIGRAVYRQLIIVSYLLL